MKWFLAKSLLLTLLGIVFVGETHSQNPTIHRYTCLTKPTDTDKWLEEGSRRRDSLGILTQGMQYHPLGIAFFGIMRYEDFLATGDSAYFYDVIDQYNYFCDTKRTILVDSGKGLVLPYRVSFKDMPIPWHSGMSQGAGLSYLTRYYALTGDTTALRKMRQVFHVLAKPAQLGGTVGRTPEGAPWIEEYPNSKLSPQVLNGFINGLIGVHEYSERFPEDTLARRLDSTCYQSLVNSLEYYDRRDWTDYKRIPMSVIQLSYLRYQLAEMEHLYELYRDAQLQRQMMIWSLMTYGQVDTMLKSYRVPSYQFGAKVIDSLTGRPIADDSMFQRVMRPLSAMLGVSRSQISLKLPRDGDLALPLPADCHYVQLQFSASKHHPSLEAVAHDAAGKSIEATLEWKGASLAIRSWVPMADVTIAVTDELPKRSKLMDVLVPDLDQQLLPMYGLYKVPGLHELVKGESYALALTMTNVVGAILFYRYESSERRMVLTRWDKDVFVELPSETFTAPSDGFYEFFIGFPIKMPAPKVESFGLKQQ